MRFNPFTHHRFLTNAIIALFVIAFLLSAQAGELKPLADIAWLDILGEGGIVLMTLTWIAALLISRPPGKVTSFLVLGLGLFMFSASLDLFDEWLHQPTNTWLTWIESLPAPIGMIFTSLGLYQWHQEQYVLNRQLKRREAQHREHELVCSITGLYKADYLQAVLKEQLSEPQPLQLAAVRALANHDADGVADVILAEWRSFSPKVRGAVVEALTSTNRGTEALLQAVEGGAVKRGDIERAVKQQLMSHRDKAIANSSKTLFGSDVNTNRSKVVADFQDVLQLEGDAVRGTLVFKKICAQCHKVGNMGHQVAPDLASVKNKSEADLLIAILDPNREAQPAFNTYTVVTNQGRTYNGIIASESSSSITLRKAEATQHFIVRSNIEDLVSTGVSLMPEGLEKDLSKQQIADVIAFVKSVGRSK